MTENGQVSGAKFQITKILSVGGLASNRGEKCEFTISGSELDAHGTVRHQHLYIADGTLAVRIVQGVAIGQASMTRIEVLGYQDITVGQEAKLRQIFTVSKEFDLEAIVVERAITLKQGHKMKLGDATMAATAIEHNCELWTANTKYFSGIEGLKLHNPINNK